MQDPSGILNVPLSSGAKSGAPAANFDLPDPDLADLLTAWTSLPPALKTGIVAMVRAARATRLRYLARQKPNCGLTDEPPSCMSYFLHWSATARPGGLSHFGTSTRARACARSVQEIPVGTGTSPAKNVFVVHTMSCKAVSILLGASAKSCTRKAQFLQSLQGVRGCYA